MVKKRIALILSVVLLVAVLTACGADYSDSGYTGKWKATTASMSGMELSVEEAIGEVTLELESNGNATITISDKDAGGDWEPTDGGITLKDSSDEMTFKDKDGKLVGEMSGITLTFEKE
ncbi:MAG: hypothetical protein VB031_09635 [Eubacteriaceae bacterium]|nr:hypothetical protein [Eubacteriaceae bacterium]